MLLLASPATALAAGSWNQALASLQEAEQLVIRGENTTSQPLLVIVRIDDQQSHDYSSRFNAERMVAAGVFELVFSPAELKESNPDKTPLDINRLERIYVFSDQPEDLKVHSVSKQSRQDSPDHIIALDFGPDVLDGTQQVALNNTGKVELKGVLQQINRPGSDPWIRDGIAGIDQLRLPLAKGIWRLHLYREDIGEWENLPRQQNLDIRIGERIISAPESLADPVDWYQRHYLKFYQQIAQSDPWQDVVSQRGLVQTFDVVHEGGWLTIEFLGGTPQERYLAGLLAQVMVPDSGQPKQLSTQSSDRTGDERTSLSAVQWLDSQREDYFRQHWFVEKNSREYKGVAFGGSLQRYVADNETDWLTIDIDVPEDGVYLLQISDPDQVLQEKRLAIPRWYRDGSHNRLYKSHRHLKMLADDQLLVAGKHQVILSYRWPLSLANAGKRQSGMTLQLLAKNSKTGSMAVQEAMKITLLSTGNQLDNNAANVGIYLDAAPHLNWFPEWQRFSIAQTYCDLKFLAQYGLKALAPPLVTPTQNNSRLWQQQLDLYEGFYPNQKLLAYTPFKRLQRYMQGPELAAYLTGLYERFPQSSKLYWSVADEAHKSQYTSIYKAGQDLHSANPSAKTAGQLNNPSQNTIIDQLDLVLINHGFGVDADTLSRLEGREVWLYNMPFPRLASGAFSWRTGAGGYIQWHGRMPTANPYDPTDGREADYHFFPPSPVMCMAKPDIDRRLLDLVKGRNDGLWLTWLAKQKLPEAKSMLQSLQQQISPDWQRSRQITEQQLDDWVVAIKKLAWRLKHTIKDTDSAVQNAKVNGGYDNESLPDRTAQTVYRWPAIGSGTDLPVRLQHSQ